MYFIIFRYKVEDEVRKVIGKQLSNKKYLKQNLISYYSKEYHLDNQIRN